KQPLTLDKQGIQDATPTVCAPHSTPISRVVQNFFSRNFGFFDPLAASETAKTLVYQGVSGITKNFN
ncbi:hypothetical protein, partial [Phormidium sp. FACHB-1136]|uniref:hypothetical protein n=1 Tax=Phormidium sp. FACHB-1136 TaxID=2692848 RepID=UPI001A7E598A